MLLCCNFAEYYIFVPSAKPNTPNVIQYNRTNRFCFGSSSKMRSEQKCPSCKNLQLNPWFTIPSRGPVWLLLCSVQCVAISITDHSSTSHLLALSKQNYLVLKHSQHLPNKLHGQKTLVRKISKGNNKSVLWDIWDIYNCKHTFLLGQHLRVLTW